MTTTRPPQLRNYYVVDANYTKAIIGDKIDTAIVGIGHL